MAFVLNRAKGCMDYISPSTTTLDIAPAFRASKIIRLTNGKD